MMKSMFWTVTLGLLVSAADLRAELPDPIFSDEDLAIAAQLRDSGLQGTGGFDVVEELTTLVGPRLAGSPADAKAVEWAIDYLTEAGFDRVFTEPVTFPTWHRNMEKATITAPVERELVTLALGFSPATPEGGIEAEVVMLDDYAALQDVAAERVAGKIIFVRNRMERARDGSGYGPAVQARSLGARIAAQKGAVAYVIRSIGTSTNRFAHTGTQRFDVGVRSLPAVAISNPDADQLERVMALGEPVSMHVEVDAEFVEAYTSQNVIAEITGSQHPEQVVAIAGHLDSWDVGTGALDDGAGIGIVTEAGRLIQALDQKPDRSIQIIFFAAEEIGLWGGRAWAENNKDNFHNIQLGAESDFGAGPIYEIKAKVADEAQPVIRAIADALAPLGIEFGGWGAWGGPDFRPAGAYGMAAVDLRQDGRNYFDYHHTENDTLDKIDPADMKHNAAAYAVLAWLAAQSPVSFGSGPELIDPQG
ncbi:MAG: M28 family peptidase [Wenzhouxiangella sp.]|jgi:hypothetical protein|nr:M28 family peptidase [Wenzhouxiangella sp.]MDR9453145.1 M28 family peptidase [Wenzhouxiangella sp.]